MKLFKNTPEDVETIRKVCSILDYSSALVTNASKAMVIKACDEAKQYKFRAVPVFPCYLPLVAEQLKGTDIAPQLPCGFPCGGQPTSIKKAEVIQALQDGAKEIDMVLNIAHLLDKDYKYVENDIRTVVDTAKPAGVSVKVIIEIGYLQDSDKREALEIAVACGAEFVKTCTGFAEGRATIREIAQLVDFAKGRIKIKATGGVPSLEDAAAFIEVGAARVAGRFGMVNQMQNLGIMGF